MNLNDSQVQAIVEQVVQNIANKNDGVSLDPQKNADASWGVFHNIEDAIVAAADAFDAYRIIDLDRRAQFIEAIRKMGVANKETLARMVYDETRMGRYQDKILKHEVAALDTPGIENLKPQTWSGNNGLAVEEYAPFGVIGAIAPSTHPSETIINNAIMMLAAGNTVVFGAHPAAKKVSAYVVQLMNKALVEASAPQNLVTTTAEPTIESAGEMFKHPKIALLSITGGPGVVRAALKSNKKVIAAGPGNPPVVIDESADLKRAAHYITKSASFDNNILCTAEKEIYVVDKIFNAFMQAMKEAGNYLLTSSQMDRLATAVFEKKKYLHVVRREFVGRNASVLAKQIGVNISDDVPLLLGETNKDHLFVIEEQLMPCIPVVRVKNYEEGIQLALEAEHGYRHTASTFTQDMNKATNFACQANCSIFVINGGTYQGDGGAEGEGTLSYTIATPTGECVTRPKNFARIRRIMTAGALRFV